MADTKISDLTAASALAGTEVVPVVQSATTKKATITQILAGTVAPAGLTGATAASRYVGGTTGGAPASGTFAVGDYVVDQTGVLWVCITAGSPGTWLPGGSGVELGYTELSADPATNGTTVGDIAGLSVTITAPSRSFMVEGYLPVPLMSAAQPAFATLYLTDSANVELARAFVAAVAINYAPSPVVFRAHLPRTGGTAYPITPGTSYTFKLRAVTSTGTLSQATTSGLDRPHIRAVTL